MAMLKILLPLLTVTLTVYTQNCTTVQPIFEPPIDATKTIFANTTTTTSTVTCDGCLLEVSTFRATTGGSTIPSQTTTKTIPLTTSASFVCSPSPNVTSSISSSTTASTPSLTASPLPPVDPQVQTFINELSTALLYVELLANGGNSEKLCSVINPAGLDKIDSPSINGSAVQTEVCALGAIQAFDPGLASVIVQGNQLGVKYVEQALFAVQVAGKYAGGTNLETLCDEIEADLLNALFIGYINGVGTLVKDYVCSVASASASSPAAATAY